MDTKYNLSITTSGEDGDHASTNISTSDPGKLADILQLAGMSGGHPVPMNAQAAPEESHGSCDVCGGMHEDDEHVVEGDSWDNEPEEFIHSPEEVTQTGNDLHKVKKTYPKVNGGDNPMALAETELRHKYDDFIAERCQPELGDRCFTVQKPESDHDHDTHVHGKDDDDDFWRKGKKKPKTLRQLGKGFLTDGENKIEMKNMNIKEVLELIDERGKDDAEGPAGGYGSHTDADYELDADGNVDYTKLKPGRAIEVLTKPEKQTGRENNQSGGSYTDADYDEHGNFIGTPLNVFGRAPVNTGGKEGASGEIYGSKSDKPVGYGRAEGLQARLDAAAEAGFDTLKQARAAGHPAGSEHTWTGSGAHAWPPRLSAEEQEREMDHMRQDAEAEESYLSKNYASIAADQAAGEASRDTDIGGTYPKDGDYAPGQPGYPDAPDDVDHAEMAKLRQNAGLLAKPPTGGPPGFDPRENPYDKSGKPGSKIDYSPEAIAARQRARQIANAEGGGPEGSSAEKHGSARFDKDGKIIGGPFKGPFTKAPKQTGRENNQSGGSAEFDKQGKIIGKPFKGPFTKAPKPTEGGRD